MAKQRGKLIVISGPSGAGKSTVVFKALEGRNDICFSVSATTRKPRPGEVDGKEYFFVDLDKFREMVENDEFLEHAEYVANSYGTPKAYVEKKLSDLFGASWMMGHRYTCAITVSLDEILWDPAVETWVDEYKQITI